MNQKVGQASRLPRRPNRPTPVTALALARSPGQAGRLPTLGPPRFMVPMHAQKAEGGSPRSCCLGSRPYNRNQVVTRSFLAGNIRDEYTNECVHCNEWRGTIGISQ